MHATHPPQAHGWPAAPLGLGTVQWGDRLVWGFGSGFVADDAHDAFWISLAAGVSLVDTAEIYGMGASERLIGHFLKTVRVPVQVATKFFPMPWRIDRGSFFSALGGSLRRLGLARVSLYQIHWPTPLVPVERLMDWLAEAIERGLVERAGVSNFDLRQTERAQAALARRGIALASNQIPFSLLERSAERTGLLAACRELGVTVIAYSPLEQGLLTGKYGPDRPPPGIRTLTRRRDLNRLSPLLAALREVGAAHRRTPAQVALRWTIEKGTLPIPGAKNATQAAENAGALEFSLSSDDLARLDEAIGRRQPSRAAVRSSW
ncbi:MAG: aldo/keto reductase [Dehalococcoidia bacterium]